MVVVSPNRFYEFFKFATQLFKNLEVLSSNAAYSYNVHLNFCVKKTNFFLKKVL